jgi:alkylhydroperoxidase/carboxymuconolactone decarboxylase family protein YurZ
MEAKMLDPVEDALARGVAIRERLLGTGDNETNKVRGPNDAVMPELSELSDEANWGRVWTRPGLPLRDRSMCLITTMIAMHLFSFARIHIGGAKRIGITEAELQELVLQMLFYVGLPVVRTALTIVAEVYADDSIPSGSAQGQAATQ